MKSVAVVGAGPGGLVAAKTLLHHIDSPFKVTIFEKADNLGGLWNLQKGGLARHGFLNPETPTNLSKFTVSFSDLSWDSVDLGLGNPGKQRKHQYSRVPMFPKAWMASQYLEQYADRYSIRDKIELTTEVVGAERVQEDGILKWKISTRKANLSSASQTRLFDYMVVATGFFAKPRPLPPSLTPAKFPAGVKTVHSSQYRTLDDLVSKGNIEASRNKILVIGGGNSSGEVAGTLAQHISDALHAPAGTRSDLKNVQIIHVTPRPLYGLPPFVPAGPNKAGFIPLDLRLYDFDARPGKIDSYGGKAPEEVMGIVHGFIRSMVGSDQSDLGASALVSSEDGGKTTGAAYVTLSESFPEFVRSGLIKPIEGYASSLKPGSRDSDGLTVHIERKDGTSEDIDGIAAVINASGYTPAAALNWLPQDVQRDLEYDPTSPRLPLILDMLQTYNSSVPELGFIGFYEGPYWGVMEMQARLLTETWTSMTKNESFKTKDRYFETKTGLRELRESMQSRDRLIPQYWFSDYLGYMEEAAVDLNLQRNDHPFEQQQGPTSPGRYLSSDTSAPEAARIITDLQRTMIASKNGAFLARVTFRGLQGKWKLQRTIKSASSALPSGTFVGAASLQPRFPTSDKENDVSSFDGEYMYAEQGTFTPESGPSMQASRHYVYRFREADDCMSVWFVKPDDFKEVDYPYHELSFTDIKTVEGQGSKQTAAANAQHLCEADLYKTDYRFDFRGISVESWKCKHTVNGPAKDYTAEAVYTR